MNVCDTGNWPMGEKMALTPRLEVRQSQSLTLTPQLMQSIKLLQLSHLELNAFVEAELLRNPVLERDDSRPDDPDGEPEQVEKPPAYADSVTEGDQIRSAATIASDMDTDVANMFPEQVGQDSVAQSTMWPEGRGLASSGEAPGFPGGSD